MARPSELILVLQALTSHLSFGWMSKTMVPITSFLGTLNIRCRIIIGIQKRTIILTTTHLDPFQHSNLNARAHEPCSLEPWNREGEHYFTERFRGACSSCIGAKFKIQVTNPLLEKYSRAFLNLHVLPACQMFGNIHCMGAHPGCLPGLQKACEVSVCLGS